MENIKPDHYQAGPGDVIDFCQRHSLNFGRGNIVKYITRAGKKGDEMTDLLKALEYLDREIAFLKGIEKDEIPLF